MRFFINEGDQTILAGDTETFVAPNDFIAKLLEAASSNGGTATMSDDAGQPVTATIEG